MAIRYYTILGSVVLVKEPPGFTVEVFRDGRWVRDEELYYYERLIDGDTDINRISEAQALKLTGVPYGGSQFFNPDLDRMYNQIQTNVASIPVPPGAEELNFEIGKSEEAPDEDAGKREQIEMPGSGSKSSSSDADCQGVTPSLKASRGSSALCSSR